MRTLLDSDTRPERRTALVAAELNKYDIDIATLTETRFNEEGSLTEHGQGYTFFWRGVPTGQRRLHGVGFAIRNRLTESLEELPVGHSERIMSVRVPLPRGQHLSVICAYAPTLVADESDKDSFYALLQQVIDRIDKNDKLIVSGDFNARVGADHLLWDGVLGVHGVGKMNSNGLRLLSLCSQYRLTITNTRFQLRNKHKNTWKHPRSGHWHMLDHVLVRQRDKADCTLTKVMRGAECGTDHQMQKATFRLSIRPKVRKRGSNTKKLNTSLLYDPSFREGFQLQVEEVVRAQEQGAEVATQQEASVLDSWEAFSKNLYAASAEALGRRKKKHRDWFDENDMEIQEILLNKNKKHNIYLSNPSTTSANAWREARSETQRQTREIKNRWWRERAAEIQGYAESGKMKEFYDTIKAVTGPTTNSLSPLRAEDGVTLLKDRAQILNRWATYFSSLLNNAFPLDETALDELPVLPTIHEMDALPTIAEVEAAIAGLKNCKAAGPDGIPPEVYKYGGGSLAESMLKYCVACWEIGDIPTQWKRAKMISIYKRKGEKSDCTNYRGLSLLDVASKIFAKILLARFNRHIANKILPESQCGFRADRSTADMIFVCRQLLEKSREQRVPISIAFIDLQKAFDTVNREALLKVVERFGCPPVFVSMLRALHAGTVATVAAGSDCSEPFAVTVGVKQGCVLAPVLFNVYLLAVSMLALGGERRSEAGGVDLRYRFEGGAFNLQRLKARTRVSHSTVRDLQYADDAAIVCSNADELQRELDVQNIAYTRMGLRMNARKTEVMHGAVESDPTPITLGQSTLPVTTNFTYLGSIISNDCSLDKEIVNRIGKASAAFGQLRDKVYLNHDLSIQTKMSVYSAIVVAILLYGCETWTVYSRQLKQLEKFHMSCLRQMLRITWKDKITNNVVLSRCGGLSLESMIASRTLRWAGHLSRMDEARIPKVVLYSERSAGTRPVGRPKKRHKDHLKSVLKSCQIDPCHFETLAADRVGWRGAVAAGVVTLEETLRNARDRRRRARHLGPPAAADSLIICTDCGRGFKTSSGYQSHQRAHERERERRRLRIEGPP